MREGKLRLYIILLLLIIAFSTVSIITPIPVKSKVTFYAEKVKWPTPGVPEPVLEGGNLTVIVLESGKARDWRATLTPWYGGEFELELLNSEFLEESYGWKLTFKVPKGILRGGLKDAIANLKVNYKVDSGEVEVLEPKSIWVLREPPEKLTIMHLTDTHSPQTIMYEEAWRESFLIDPDLIVVSGDNVHTAGSATDWNKLMPLLVGFIDPKWLIIGNHDYNSPGNPKTYSRIVGFQNYSITIGNFLLLALDSGVDGYVPLERLAWAENVLKRNVEKTKIIVFHHPIFGDFDLKNVNATFKVESLEDVDKLKEYMYSSWRSHYREAKELLRLVLEYDVRLVLSGHIHSDLNVVLVDGDGRKHYFIATVTCSPQKFWDNDWSGYRLITLYSNGTLDETSIYYDPKGLFGYPNSIPLDTGLREYQGPVKTPYKIGYLEYYYTPSNNGSSYSVSVKIVNELNETFKDSRLIFVMPGDLEYEEYYWIPSPPSGEIYTFKVGGLLYVVIDGLEIKANTVLFYTLTSKEDGKPPVKPDIRDLREEMGWFTVTVRARDEGWGVKSVDLEYSVDSGDWIKPKLSDLIEWENGYVVYKFWLQKIGEYKTIKVRAIVEDFSGKTSVSEREFKLVEETIPTTPSPSPTETTPSPSPTSPSPTPTETTPTPTPTEITPVETTSPTTVTTQTVQSPTTPLKVETISETVETVFEDVYGKLLVVLSVIVAIVLLGLVLFKKK